ncbi:MAG: hypothetical protein ACI9BW_002569 [Gammaproteobacteria bacterium]
MLPALEVKQQWEGCVTEVNEDSFEAILVDLNSSVPNEFETAKFEFDQISEDDLLC